MCIHRVYSLTPITDYLHSGGTHSGGLITFQQVRGRTKSLSAEETTGVYVIVVVFVVCVRINLVVFHRQHSITLMVGVHRIYN